MAESSHKIILNAFKEIGASVNQRLNITGLNDTPSGYLGHSGDYLVVNDGESGIHFTGIEKIASDLTDYGFGGSTGSSHFTGLQDTPNDYNDGAYLKSTANGLEYAGIVPTSYADILSLPSSPSEHEGEIVKVGCDIYLSCNGEWQKLDTSSQDNIPSSYPACVTTTEEMVQYDAYQDRIIEEHTAQSFENALNGTDLPLNLQNVCLFKNEEASALSIDENEDWTNKGSLPNGLTPNFSNDFKRTHNIITQTKDRVVVEVIESSTRKIKAYQINKTTGAYAEIFNKEIPTSQKIVDAYRNAQYFVEGPSSLSLTNKIYLYQYDSSLNTYSQIHQPIDAQTLLDNGFIDTAYNLYRVHVINEANSILLVVSKNLSGDLAACLVRLNWNGSSWELANVFQFAIVAGNVYNGDIESGPGAFRDSAFSEDGSRFIISTYDRDESQALVKCFELDFTDSSYKEYMPRIPFTQDVTFSKASISPDLQTLILLRSGSSSLAKIYKSNGSTWSVVNENTSIKDDNQANFSFDGNILLMQEDNDLLTAYYYNNTTNSYSQLGSPITHDTFTTRQPIISNDGKSIFSNLGTLYNIKYSTLPTFSESVYNNEIYIEESTYKWGIFEQGSAVNLNGSVDANCTFKQWESSDVTFGNSTSLNTTVDINSDASITGVFNCG